MTYIYVLGNTRCKIVVNVSYDPGDNQNICIEEKCIYKKIYMCANVFFLISKYLEI